MQVYFLGQYVKQTGHSAYKMQQSMEKRPQIAEISSAVSYEVIAS